MLGILSLMAMLQTALAESTPDSANLNDPETVEYKRWHMSPVPTRAGFLRFVGTDKASPEWTPFYILRFLEADEPLPVRLALLNLIERSGGDWQEELYLHFRSESNPEIRRGIIEMTRRLNISEKEHMIRLASSDSASIVRAEAMRAIGRCPNTDFTHEIEMGLKDSDAEVIQFAARSAGWNKMKPLTSNLADLLEHDDSNVRYQALNALKRINPEEASRIAPLHIHDQDSRVRRISRKLIGIK